MNRNMLLGLLALIVAGLAFGYYILQGGLSGGGSDAAAGAYGTDGADSEAFTFSWSGVVEQYPEFADVIQPESREQFLTPHATDIGFGDPEAPVTIIEFFSYACPHCKTFHEGPYQRTLAQYVETGQVYFIKRDFLLNDRILGFELRAGAGAQCLRDDGQKHAFANRVFEQQNRLRSAADPIDALIPVFEAAGLEAGQAVACMTDQKNISLVYGRSKRASEERWVTGTPTIFINAERYLGNSSNFSELSLEIERAIQSAR